MGAHSSLRVTRSKARELYLKEMIGEIPDDELEAFLDRKLDHALYNAVIIPDYDTGENDNGLVEHYCERGATASGK